MEIILGEIDCKLIPLGFRTAELQNRMNRMTA